MSVIWYIIIGIVAGFLAGKIMRGGGFGLLINLVVGILPDLDYHCRRRRRLLMGKT